MTPGAEAILKTPAFQAALRWADVVVTGEGCLDATSTLGKAPVALAQMAEGMGKPVIAIVGAAKGRGANSPFAQTWSCFETPQRPSRRAAAVCLQSVAETAAKCLAAAGSGGA